MSDRKQRRMSGVPNVFVTPARFADGDDERDTPKTRKYVPLRTVWFEAGVLSAIYSGIGLLLGQFSLYVPAALFMMAVGISINTAVTDIVEDED